MSVRLNITKRGKIIILAILVLLFTGTGGYLLWRVNQQDTVAPTDSDATGGTGACCGTPGCVAGWKCDSSQSCGETKTVTCTATDISKKMACPSYKGATANNASTVAGTTCQSIGQTATCNYSFGPNGSSGGKCVKETSDDPVQPVNPGVCDIRKCEWPETLMSSNNCACEKCNGTNGCSGNPPKCTPASCPSGYESCGLSGDGGMSDCTAEKSCVAYHPDCNNPSVTYRYCRPKPSQTNTCDSGAWVKQPTGIYAYCDAITYSANATDSDGIDESSISVKLNNIARSTFTKLGSGTTTIISEALSSTTNCLAPGSYTLAMDWKDTKGASSTNCALNTSFTVQSEVLNPDWSLKKIVVEKCIDENTENPKSELTYAITVKNTGAGSGEITKIVDTLDTKVLESYLSKISNSGIYSNGNITWTLSTTEKVFTAGQEKVFTYTVTIPKTTFGIYTNTVTAYPSTGENVIANAEIGADCMISVPETGIFDSTTAKISLGVVFILFGINFTRIMDLTKKLSISANDMSNERRKKNFEKRVVKS